MISLESLNEPQRDAVTYQGGRHCLILAGAGSGKTRVLTHRIAWLLTQGVPAYAIIAFTFTNKAAAEMRERAQALIEGDASIQNCNVQLSTFHAFGARFLHQYGDYVGLDKSSFSIYAETEQKNIIKTIMTELSILHPKSEILDKEEKKEAAAVSDYLNDIMAWKEKGISPETARNEARTREAVNIANVYELYEKRLLDNNAVDFAGLLLWPLHIMRSFEDVRERIQSRYRHILVDEFQDTNGVQLDLLHTMMGPRTRITAVGDDDQSIYTWRGADPAAILEFSDRFGECDIFKLEQNYRSTKAILNCAANLIACNAVRTEKRLWTDRDGGTPVHIVAYDSDRDEIDSIIESIRTKQRNTMCDFSDFAVLFRKNSMSLGFERAFAARDIRYQLVGSLGFFDREEIIDLMAYLRLVVNPCDTMALRRIINKPVRGIGQKTAEKIIDLMEKKAMFGVKPAFRLIEILRDISTGQCRIPRAGAKVIEGCTELLRLFESLADWEKMPPHEVLQSIIDHTHFMTHLKKSMQKKEADYSDAKDRVDSLLATLEAYPRDNEGTLADFLESTALVHSESDDSKDSVKLMTIHSAKGLEFDTVFIAGAEEHILPLERSGICDIEEERRLMYVAMTRAKRELFISHAARRLEYGNIKAQTPSRFFDEMTREDDPEGMTEFTECPPLYTSYSHSEKGFSGKLAWRSSTAKKSPAKRGDDFQNEVGGGVTRSFGSPIQNRDQTFWDDRGYEEDAVDIYHDVEPVRHIIPRRTYTDDEPAVTDGKIAARSKNGKELRVGSRIKHAVHGCGTVIQLEKASGDYKATVDFIKSGKRTIIARFLVVI